ncbi:hypothetical protein OQA88_13451 [Cercophora sp. LCS_1]
MVQRLAAAMFADFPGNDPFEKALNAMTGGDVEGTQSNFRVSGWHESGYYGFSLFYPGARCTNPNCAHDKHDPEDGHKMAIDIKEHLLVHTFRDLIDFLVDFQKSRTGKPTKRMLAQLKGWDSKFNLQQATNEERVRWRRSYTINWLYDLVNLYSSPVVQRNLRGENHALEAVDWSADGPWAKHRRLFGLQDFAAFVCTLAWQKEGTDVRKRILPHHVFQLQLIVDSLCVSLGWRNHPLQGHMLSPPARSFQPLRDLDFFLRGGSSHSTSHGMLDAFSVVQECIQGITGRLGPALPPHYANVGLITDRARQEFDDWLGETLYSRGLPGIPPSRFSNSNPNGLWEYSPFLCGVGLVEALQLNYKLGMYFWDKCPQVAYLVHLGNALIKKGYLSSPRSVDLPTYLGKHWSKAFFAQGTSPRLHFGREFVTQISKFATLVMDEGPAGWAKEKRAMDEINRITKPDATLHDILDMDCNTVFRNCQSELVKYENAQWDPERIPDSQVNAGNFLGAIRLNRTKQIVDLVTGKLTPEDSELFRRWKNLEWEDGDVLETKIQALVGGESWLQMQGHWMRDFAGRRIFQPAKDGVTNDRLLSLLKVDFMRDVCGIEPYSGLNFAKMTVAAMGVSLHLQAALHEAKDPIYLWASSPETSPTFVAK